MSYYHTCPYCGANLDPGELCSCIRAGYPRWKQSVERTLSSIGLIGTEDYPLIDFPKLYKYGKTPREAADLAISINPFLKHKESPLHQSSTKQ